MKKLEYTIKSRVYGKKLVFVRPEHVKYIYVNMNESDNIDGDILSMGGKLNTGTSLTYPGDSMQEFVTLVLSWYKKALECEVDRREQENLPLFLSDECVVNAA